MKLWLAFAYLCVVWGSSYLFIKIGLEYWPPFLMAASRNLIACFAVVLVWGFTRRSEPAEPLLWWPPVVFGLVNGSALALLFWGGQYISSGQSAVLIGAVPLFTMLISRWWYKESLSWTKLAAVGVGLTGVMLAVLQRTGAGFEGSELLRVLGQVSVLGTALGYAISFAVAKRFSSGDLIRNTAVHLGVSGLWLLLISLWLDPPATASVLSAPALFSVLYLAILGSAVAYWCKAFLLVHLPSAQATYTALINPVVAVILGVTILGERLTGLGTAGILLVLVGVWLVNRPAGQASSLPKQRGRLRVFAGSR